MLARLRKHLLMKPQSPPVTSKSPDTPDETKQPSIATSEDELQRLNEQVRVLTERNSRLEKLVEIKDKKIQLLLKQLNDSSQ